jgi:hypothetical protein
MEEYDWPIKTHPYTLFDIVLWYPEPTVCILQEVFKVYVIRISSFRTKSYCFYRVSSYYYYSTLFCSTSTAFPYWFIDRVSFCIINNLFDLEVFLFCFQNGRRKCVHISTYVKTVNQLYIPYFWSYRSKLDIKMFQNSRSKNDLSW